MWQRSKRGSKERGNEANGAVASSSNLVFDIGLHRGDDSAFYLHLGYRVVGIEANPLLARGCSQRFEKEIREGRMKVVNAGVLAESGEFVFYRNLTDDGWSSFVPKMGQYGGKWEELLVPSLTTQQLVQEYGKPFFIKVDIQGKDLEVLRTLTCATAPPYISLELNCVDPIIEALIDLGYSSFKFVNGKTYRPNPPIFQHEFGWRLLRKTGRLFPPIRKAIAQLPPQFRRKSEYDPPYKYSPDGYGFTDHSSGPFGEQAAGPWLGGDVALSRFRRLANQYRRDHVEESLWWDVHARHRSYTPQLWSVDGS